MSDNLFEMESSKGDQERALTKRQDAGLMTPDSFIGMVLSQPDSAEKVQLLRELIAMQNAERERVCKENFDVHFAELRSALAPVVKTRLNTATNSKFAALEDIQSACDKIIFEHGFSYSWDEEALAEGRKCVIMYIYGYGYTRSIRWEAPHFEGNRATNPLQSAGIQSTYGQRYTYKGGFGIVIKGEDTDGATIEIDAELQAALDKMHKAENMNVLMDIYKIAYNRYERDTNMLKLVVGEYNLAKQSLARRPNNV